MAYTYKTNLGSLFKVLDKQSENAPDYSGEINIEGTMFFIDGWLNPSVNGKYLKLKIKKKDKQPEHTDIGDEL